MNNCVVVLQFNAEGGKSVDKFVEIVVDFIVEIVVSLFKSLKKGGYFCFPVTDMVGFAESRTIEMYHPFVFIQENVWQDSSNTLYIGSPYLKYWFETADEPRMLNLLNNTHKFKVSVNYYNDVVPENKIIIEGLETCKQRFPERFQYSIIKRYSSISYIEYKFMVKNQIHYRCIVGFQDTMYSERPFLEFVGKDDHKPGFVREIIESHKTG